MKLAFFVNEIAVEHPEMATTRLARAAVAGSHEVWYVGAGDVEFDTRQQLLARARRAELIEGDTLETFLARIKKRDAERLVMDSLDALFLRNEEATEMQERPWAGPLGTVFGQMLAARGVTVVNDPVTLSRATSKLYLEEFPQAVRPRSLVTRDAGAIRRFVAEVGKSVVKPIYGGKGRNVFVVEDENETNLAQIIEAVFADGYAIAQEFVDGGEEGDARIFLLDGKLIEIDGAAYAAFRRVPDGNDPRANISKGGRMELLEVGAREKDIVDTMGPKLVADGLFFVGIDVVGDKVLEINADSPGGIQSIEWLYNTDICPAIIEALRDRASS